MKELLRLWQYVAEFFLDWETYQTKVVEKTEIHTLRSVRFFLKKIV
jgi:hypothetical protein